MFGDGFWGWCNFPEHSVEDRDGERAFVGEDFAPGGDHVQMAT